MQDRTARRLTDFELKDRVFAISEPEILVDLTDFIPPSTATPTIEFLYNVTPPEKRSRPWVHCANCGRPTHWRGYVVKFDSGARCLIGKDCGAKHYGADFHLFEKEFDAQRKRQFQLRRIRALSQAFPHMLRSLAEFTALPSVLQFDEVRHAMKSRMGEITAALWAVARSGGEMAVEELVRDHAAEAARDKNLGDVAVATGQQPDDDDPIYLAVKRGIGQLDGREILSVTGPIHPFLLVEHERLKASWQYIQKLGTDRMTTMKLRKLVDDVLESVDKIDRLQGPIAALSRFFGPRNLASIATWANQVRGIQGKVESKGGTLLFTPRGKDVPSKISMPNNFLAPNFSGFETFKKAVRDNGAFECG